MKLVLFIANFKNSYLLVNWLDKAGWLNKAEGEFERF